jgi:hypothetical protein
MLTIVDSVLSYYMESVMKGEEPVIAVMFRRPVFAAAAAHKQHG